MGTVPFDTFRLWSAAASWFLRDAARSQSGRFTVKNVAASIAFGFDGTASNSAVFLMKTTSASSKSASESDFAHHPTALSQRFSSARSNAWSRAASRFPLSAAVHQAVDVSNGTVPADTRESCGERTACGARDFLKIEHPRRWSAGGLCGGVLPPRLWSILGRCLKKFISSCIRLRRLPG